MKHKFVVVDSKRGWGGHERETSAEQRAKQAGKHAKGRGLAQHWGDAGGGGGDWYWREDR